MLEVQPPADWPWPADWPPPLASTSTSPLGESTIKDLVSKTPPPTSAADVAHFDDIDSVLQSTSTPSPVGRSKPKAKSKSKPKSKSKSTRTQEFSKQSAPATLSSSASAPILPTDQWTSPAVAARRKKLTLIAGLLGVLLLMLAGIAAFIATRPATDVAQSTPASEQTNNLPATTNDPTSTPLDTARPDNENKTEPTPKPEKIPDPTTTPTTADPMEPQTEPFDPGTGPSIGPPPIATSAPPMVLPEIGNATTAPEIPDPTKAPSADPATATTKNSEPSSRSESALTPLTTLDSTGNPLGQLGELLESSGTSLSQIQDVAAVERDQQSIGVPKYFVEFPGSSKLDFEKQLRLPCAELKYESAKLSTVLSDITTLTGIPITIDTSSVLAVNPNANPTIDVDLQEQDFAATINTILQPLQLNYVSTENGLLVQLADRGTYLQQQYPLPKFPGDAAAQTQAANELLIGIQSLIEPDTWRAAQNPATIEINGDQLTVYQSPLAQHQIDLFLKKLTATITLLEQPNDPIAKQMLTTRWAAIADRLEQPSRLQHVPDRPLVNLLTHLQSATGLTVLVNWEAVRSLGWTPETLVPGLIEEATLGDALNELTRSLRLTLRAVDETTVELTSFEVAAQLAELEMYSFGKILKGKLTEQQAQTLIIETLGPQLQSARFVYEPKYQVFVVFAPQSLQKQVAAVIEKLEKL